LPSPAPFLQWPVSFTRQECTLLADRKAVQPSIQAEAKVRVERRSGFSRLNLDLSLNLSEG